MSAGEFSRLDRLAPHLAGGSVDVGVGVGDDAAVVRIGGADVVVCVDAVVEGVHFRRDLSGPADVGWKVVAVNVSDAAAMGASPRAAVVALHRPAGLSETDIDELYAGMAEAARRWDVALVGGDTVTAGEWAVSLTLLGELSQPAITRSGARPGDVLVLAGRIGAASAALHAVAADRQPDPAHLAAHRRPLALPATGMALAAAGATAMIDLSDGLGTDAGHLARASGVELRLDAAQVAAAVAPGVAEASGEGWLDRAISGGEDFALLAAVPADRTEQALAAVAATGESDARVVGRVRAAPPPPAGVSVGVPPHHTYRHGVGEEGASGTEGVVWLEGDAGAGPRRIDHLGYDHG